PEGACGNACASRAWKGTRRAAICAAAHFLFLLYPTEKRFIALEATSPVRLTDKFGRAITDLRISITDRCNYKCVYCRTGNEGPIYAELPLAEYLRLAKIFVGLGIEKIRITGGEPLLRSHITDLIRELAQLRIARGERIGEPIDTAITTNGHLLAEMAQPLKDAGLHRITISMDAVDAERFARITGVPNGFSSVLAGSRAAQQAGLEPVKVNCVLLRGFNDDQIVPFGKFARDEGVVLRFIEFMPLGVDRGGWRVIVVKIVERLECVAAFMLMVEVAPAA